jgi:hypothetical protein
MLPWLRPKTWWQAALFYGAVMFTIYVIKDAIDGRLTFAQAGIALIIWGSAGLVFAILLTGSLSLLSRKNQFRGSADKEGDR